MKIKITSDSTCDLSKEQLSLYDITLCPLVVNKGDESFRDGVDIFPQDIYDHVDAGGDLCTTSALNPMDYIEFFTPLVQDFDAVIHINLSSGISSCHQNARLAAAQLENVYVIDSKNLSTGHGLLVLKAAELAREGKTPEEIVELVNATAEKVSASFVLEQLAYMRKGGRCSSVAALGANLLKLKPCIEVKDGTMGVAKKYRGSLEKCLREYISDQLSDLSSICPQRVFITHSSVSPEIEALAVNLVRETGYFQEVCVTRAGCTICCHCGPGTLGVLFIRK